MAPSSVAPRCTELLRVATTPPPAPTPDIHRVHISPQLSEGIDIIIYTFWSYLVSTFVLTWLHHEPIFTRSKRLQQVQVMRLYLPSVGLVTRCEVRRGIRIALERPQQPVENNLAEPSAIRVVKRTSVPNIDIALPRRDARCEVLEVALALSCISHPFFPIELPNEEVI